MPRTRIRRLDGPVQFQAGELESDLLARADIEDRAGAGRVAQRDLDRYYRHLHIALISITPSFTAEEVTVIVNALNGTFTEPHTAGLFWANVDDFLSDQQPGDPWYFDRGPFVQRLRGLSPFTALAISDAVERFFLRSRLDITETLDEAYRAVGLIH